MDGTLAEIRLFAANFNPRNWSLCYGQLMSIAQNQALFSLIGTYYGGDGRTTFGLPDLRGRGAVGAGTGPGLTPATIGEMKGHDYTTLVVSQLPAHHHTASWGQTSGSATGVASGSANVTPIAVADGGNLEDPTGAFPAALEDGYSNSTSDHVNMAPITGTVTAAVSITDVSITGNVTVNNTGSNSPISLWQPSTVLNYIICTAGLYPSRN
jgi:microcystin-dependent protein